MVLSGHSNLLALCQESIRYRKMNGNTLVLNDYHISKAHKLGEGSTGAVYFGQNAKKGYKVAVKEIDITKLTPNIEKQIENEIKNLTVLSSPYIVKLYDYCRCGNFIYMFLEYCDDGDLKKYLEKRKKSELCENQAMLFISHVIEGYRALHSHKIIHRDIKPANILLKQGIAKLADFGFSRVINNPDMSQDLTLLGTPLYTAPQILSGSNFCSKCDVWSVGVVFYEMLHGKTPWTGMDLSSLKKNIHMQPLQFKESLSQELKQLLKRMLVVQSKERISWEDIFTTRIFKVQTAPSIEEPQKNYAECRMMFHEYMRKYQVKSYLRLNMTEVNFRDSFDPDESAKKTVVIQLNDSITHKRNVAFFYSYVLNLYYKHAGSLSPSVNSCMEFQFALILKTFRDIKDIALYFEKQTSEASEKWEIFIKSAQSEELKKILTTDFDVIERLRKKIKREAEKKFKAHQLPQTAFQYFNGLESNFEETFQAIMQQNYGELVKVGNTASTMLAEYVADYVLQPARLLENVKLDFGAFYEKKMGEYGQK